MVPAIRTAVPILAFFIASALLALSSCSKSSGAREIPLAEQPPSVLAVPSPDAPQTSRLFRQRPGTTASPGAQPQNVDRDTGRTGNAPGTSNTTPAQGGNTYGTGGKDIPAFP